MKIRSGLVSNSSSSSFIVIFPREPNYINDLKQMLFGNEETYSHEYYEGRTWDTQTIAEIVRRDINRQRWADHKEDQPKALLRRALRTFHRTKEFDGCLVRLEDGKLHKVIVSENFYPWRIGLRLRPPDAPSYRYLDGWEEASEEQKRAIKKRHGQAYRRWEKDMDRFAREAARSLENKFKGRPIYVLSYGDEEGSLWGAMEHGPLFRRIPHIRISHH